MYRATLDYRTGLIQLEYEELKSHMRRMPPRKTPRPWVRSVRHKLTNVMHTVYNFWVDVQLSCIRGKSVGSISYSNKKKLLFFFLPPPNFENFARLHCLAQQFILVFVNVLFPQ